MISINIPNSVTTIGQAAFYRCYGLSSANIPISVNSLGNYIFQGCTNLKSLSIPESITIIPEGICDGCFLLKEVKLPENVVIIKSKAFHDCFSLKSITIPETVEYIYQEAFNGCNLNEGIKVLSKTPPFVYDNTFNIFDVPLIVQDESVEAYKAHDIWGLFTNISDGKYKLTYVVDEVDYKTYMIEFGDAITPESVPIKEGYTFSGWSDIPETMPAHDVTVYGSFVKMVLAGDANGDDTIDAADIVEVVNYIMGHPTVKFQGEAADANEDGTVDAADIVKIVNIIMVTK